MTRGSIAARRRPHDIDRPPFASHRLGRCAGGLRPARLRGGRPARRAFCRLLPRPVNDFEVGSGSPGACAKSANENIRGYATRAPDRIYGNRPVPQQVALRGRRLLRARSQRPAEYAEDAAAAQLAAGRRRSTRPIANAQLAIQTEAVDQFGAFSQNGASAPLRRYAQMMLPKSKAFLEYASARWPAGR